MFGNERLFDRGESGHGCNDKAKLSCGRCARLAVYLGIAEALIFIALKVLVGLASGSRALIAASLYSIQDLLSSVVAAVGLTISVKPPDTDHPYGHGKIEYLVVVLMSLMILLGMIAITITSLAGLFQRDEGAEAPTMLALWVALVCGVTCWLLSGFQRCVGTRLNSPALKSCATHMESDCVASVAVMVSVIGAAFGYTALDHVVAILEGVHVVFISGQMLGSAVGGLMDGAADPNLNQKLKRVVGQIEAVTRVRGMMARWSGQTLFTQIDLEVPGHMSVPEAEAVRVDVERAVRNTVCERSKTLVRILPASTTRCGS